MMRRGTFLALASVIALGMGTARAADLPYESPRAYCGAFGTSPLLELTSRAEISDEVDKRFERSVAVADSPEWIASRRPVFVWASEAKVACGKAIGYFKGGYLSEDYVNKCDCFYQRMESFM